MILKESKKSDHIEDSGRRDDGNLQNKDTSAGSRGTMNQKGGREAVENDIAAKATSQPKL